MASDLSNDKIVITDNNWQDYVDVSVNGEAKGRGYTPPPRSWQASYGAVNFPLIPRSEWSERIREQEANKSRISDIRMTANRGGHIPSYDQGQNGYCWAHSVVMAIQLSRAVANMPYVRLSAYSVAAVIKNFKNQGAWGALALDFIQDRGVVPMSLWPEQSMDRSLDNAANWDAAKDFRVTEAWQDEDVAVWDRNLSFDQVATLLLMNQPVVVEYNWWGHSVCAMDLVEVSRNSYGLRIINSWSDRHGTLGTEVLTGSRAIPDGAVAPSVSMGA